MSEKKTRRNFLQILKTVIECKDCGATFENYAKRVGVKKQYCYDCYIKRQRQQQRERRQRQKEERTK